MVPGKMRKLVKISVFGRWVFRPTDWVKITCKEKQKNVSIYQTAGLWHKTLKWTLKITERYHCGHGDWHSACLLLTRWASCSHCRLLFQAQQKEADKDETHASPRRTFMILEIFFCPSIYSCEIIHVSLVFYSFLSAAVKMESLW